MHIPDIETLYNIQTRTHTRTHTLARHIYEVKRD